MKAIEKRKELDCALYVSSTVLAEAIRKEAAPSEEQLRKLFYVVTKNILDSTFDEDSISELTRIVDSFFNYTEMSEPEERVFGLGASWAATKMFEDAIEIKNERDSEEHAIKLIEKHSSLFDCLFRSQGIGHSALAEVLNISPSRLSQIIGELDPMQLVSSVKLGKRKHYFLTDKSRRLKIALNQFPREVPNNVREQGTWVSEQTNKISSRGSEVEAVGNQLSNSDTQSIDKSLFFRVKGKKVEARLALDCHENNYSTTRSQFTLFQLQQ